jgi:hypothetical protein
LGPAVFAGADALSQLWLFWVAPIIGSICAAIIWKYLVEAGETRPIAVAKAARTQWRGAH